MKESLEIGNLLKKESIDVENKEKLWADIFGSEYKPDYDYSKSFDGLEDYLSKDGNFLYFFDEEKRKKIFEIINLVKNNNYKIDIKFLESLNNEQKYLISYLFFHFIFEEGLGGRFTMGKSLLIWMTFWYNYKDYALYIERSMKEIGKNFEGFNSLYFNQAFDCLRRYYEDNSKERDTDEFLFSVITEYNIINNLDSDINSFNKENVVNLGESFLLGTFHVRMNTGFGYEKKRGCYSLDKNGKKTDIRSEGIKIMDDERIVLDRDDGSLHEFDENGDKKLIDASGINYDVYLDSPSGVALFYKGSPIASMCFFVRNGNEIFINQIQKVVHYEYDKYGRCIGKYYSKEVNNIDWKNILYNVIVNLAKKYNISRIIIQGGENNRRTKEIYEDYETYYFKEKSFFREGIPEKNNGRIHLDSEIACRIYDVFAEGLGFQQDMECNWEKSI